MTTATVGHTAPMKNDWYNHAQCAGRYVNDFDLDNRRYIRQNKTGLARTLCAGCPVKRECALDALEHEAWGTVRAGIWLPAGGLMKFQKDRLVDELARVAAREGE